MTGACPVCAERDPRAIGRLSGHTLRRCRCGHGFLEVAAPSTLEAMYDDHYQGFRDDPVFKREATRILRDEIAPRLGRTGRVLDVGCGNGEFLEVARRAGFRTLGVDVSGVAGDLCRAQGHDVRIGHFPTLELPGEPFLLITFWDVVEHLPDPEAFLRRAHALLAPDGHVLIKTPRTSRASVRLSAAVPRLAGALLQAPSHVQYFGQAGLAALLSRTGFAAQHWLPLQRMRAVPAGGALRKRAARRVVAGLQRAFGDGNLLVLARKT